MTLAIQVRALTPKPMNPLPKGASAQLGFTPHASVHLVSHSDPQFPQDRPTNNRFVLNRLDGSQRIDYSSHMKTTSITDLKANLSARLKQVRNGEPLLVTDHNEPVALLQPLPTKSCNERLAGLTAVGILSPAKGPVNVEAFLALPSGHCADPLSRAIVEERTER